MRAGLYDTHKMLSLRYWALAPDTRSLPSDNHKAGRELGGCPARISFNLGTVHITLPLFIIFCIISKILKTHKSSTVMYTQSTVLVCEAVSIQ